MQEQILRVAGDLPVFGLFELDQQVGLLIVDQIEGVLGEVFRIAEPPLRGDGAQKLRSLGDQPIGCGELLALVEVAPDEGLVVDGAAETQA